MTEEQQSNRIASYRPDEWERAWMEKNAPRLRRAISGQHFLYWSLGIGFVVGLIAHVAGYVLQSSESRGFPGLLGDLLHALGWSLWTGVVVAVFVQVIPEAKKRQIGQALEAYEASRRKRPRRRGKR